MPIITFDGGKLDREKKAELVRLFTEAAYQATGISKEHFIVVIRENEMDNIGVGGDLLSEILK